MFSGLFRQKNSLIVEFDHIDDKNIEDFEGKIEEIGKYYRFSSLEEISSRLANRKKQGLAAVVFNNPRKSVLLRAIPFLAAQSIPFTCFLRADCIGLNKLPLEEELSFYSEAYPEKLSSSLVAQKITEAWTRPQEVEKYLLGLRKDLGPLPLDKIDPTFFFATWGKLLELPKDLIEWGVTLYASEQNAKLIEDGIFFMRHQLKTVPKVARLGVQGQLLGWSESSLKGFSFSACLGGNEGAVTQASQWSDLPIWRFSA
jgi:hypothetical protein